jgi:hypothetical protein
MEKKLLKPFTTRLVFKVRNWATSQEEARAMVCADMVKSPESFIYDTQEDRKRQPKSQPTAGN